MLCPSLRNVTFLGCGPGNLHATRDANHGAGKCSGIPVGYFRVYGIPLSFLFHRTMSSPAGSTGEIVPLFLPAEPWLRWKCDRFSHLVRHFAAIS